MPAPTFIRENLVYFGWSKQSSWGTSVAPTSFWRWLDGSDANPDVKFGQEREGDTSPYISLAYKQGQWWTIKIVEYARPITAGCALQAFLGTGSDTAVAGTATTLAAAITAGATTFQSTANLGNSSTAYVNFEPGYSSTTYEVANVNLASRTGTGPYTYTLANSGTFKQAHSNGGAISLASTHTFTRQPLTFDPYTLEVGFGSSAGALSQAIRIQDCVCAELDIDSEMGKPVKLTHTWYGSLSTQQASMLTAAYEQSVGPLLHVHAGTNWQVDGSNSNNGGQIRKASFKLKNSVDPSMFQTEGINPTYFQPGNIDIAADLEVIFVSFAQYNEAYYGSASPGASAQDTYLVGTGAVQTTWQADGVNSLQVKLPNVAYTAAKLTPKLDGKPFVQQIATTALRSTAQPTPLTVVLTNSQTAGY